MAPRAAARTAGNPNRLARLRATPSGVSPGAMIFAVMPSAQADAVTSGVSDFMS